MKLVTTASYQCMVPFVELLQASDLGVTQQGLKPSVITERYQSRATKYYEMQKSCYFWFPKCYQSMHARSDNDIL